MPELKMDYGMMEDMRREIKRGAEELDQTYDDVMKVAEMIDGGALIGNAGDAFSNALRATLCKKIDLLRNKFLELDADLAKAMEAMQDADTTSGSEMGL